MENRAGWRGQPCPVPAGRGGGRGRGWPGPFSTLESSAGPAGTGDTEGDTAGPGTGRARGLGHPSGFLHPGAQPCPTHRWQICPEAGFRFHSGHGKRKERRSCFSFPLKTAPSPLPWSCSPSLAGPFGFGARSAPSRRVSPRGSPRVAPRCRQQRGGSAHSPHPARRSGPSAPPIPVPQTNPREGEAPRGPRPLRFTPQLWGSRVRGVPGVRPLPVLCSATTPDGSSGASSLPLPASPAAPQPQLQPCPRCAPQHSPLPRSGGFCPARAGSPRTGSLRPAAAVRSSAVAAGFSHADSLFHTSQTKANGGIASPCQHTRSLAGRRRGERVGTARAAPPRGRSHRREVGAGRGSPGEIWSEFFAASPSSH